MNKAEREFKSLELINTDCLNHLKTLPDNSIDSLVTDPPAGISFMGKSWDDDKGGRKQWIAWMTEVMRECLRVLKPGAHGLVWALPRTSHWTATALEEAGFEVRDVITHLFGSGFPKSLDVSKAIDKMHRAEREVVGTITKSIGNHHYDNGSKMGRFGSKSGCYKMGEIALTAPSTDEAKKWQGWGTALKPASEHWVLVRKPLSEKTVAKNVLKWGTGAINIDGCRIGADDQDKLAKNWDRESLTDIRGGKYNAGKPSGVQNTISAPQGRFPANLTLDEYAAGLLDEQTGELKSGARNGIKKARSPEFQSFHERERDTKKNFHQSVGGASRFFFNSGLENQKNASGQVQATHFLYSSKVSPSERGDSTHPTMKSQKLMRYLCKLVTPPSGVILDPFMGSGSTGLAAKSEGFQFIGIEKEVDYFEITQKRVLALTYE